MKKIITPLIVFMIIIVTIIFTFGILKEDQFLQEINHVKDDCLKIKNDPATQKVTLVKDLIYEVQYGDWEVFTPGRKKYYSFAYLYIHQNKLSSVLTTEDSGTGDQSIATEYFFRNDGSIAFIISHFNTIFGNIIIETKLYFSPNGKKIKETKAFYDLHSKKPLKKMNFRQDDLHWDKPDIYLTTSRILNEFKISL